MHLSTLAKAALVLVMLLLFLKTQVHAFTATDFNSSIEVSEIDIAPTYAPAPKKQQEVRTAPPSTEQPSLPSVRQNRPLGPSKAFFSLSFTSLEADFGTVDPTNPVIRTQQIKLNPGDNNGFSLFLYENHPLQINNSQNFIPDTTCDDGKCTEQKASLWDNTLTYGFGFRCDSQKKENSPCAPEFNNQQFYKQFADVTKKEAGAQFLKTNQISGPLEVRMTYKLNVAGTQAKGRYENSLVFIAAPRL